MKRWPYQPDYATRPGETILEVLRRMTQAKLAKQMGRPVEQVSRLINGHIQLTPSTAVQLERVLGIAAESWLNLEGQYRLQLLRNKRPKKRKKHV